MGDEKNLPRRHIQLGDRGRSGVHAGDVVEFVEKVNVISTENNEFGRFNSILSHERIGRYIEAADGDVRVAHELYALNTRVSECLYVSLQMLEVALRNRFHAALSSEYGAEWYDQVGVITTQHQRQKISDAKISLVQDRKPLEPGRIVASLTFGFWTSCLGTEYEERLWRAALHRAFTHAPKATTRKSINRNLTQIRRLRNRIAHHEPILRWNLPKHHANTIMFTEWLAPEAADWTRSQCRFSEVYDPDLSKLFRKEKE